MIVRIKKTSADIPTPEYQTVGSAGCDLSAIDGFWIPAGGTCIVATGVFLEVPSGYECQVRSRSGLARKHGVVVFNSPGTVDSDFRGEMMVLLYNASKEDYNGYKGDRIAQMVFAPVVQAQFELVDQLAPSERGEGGWGSTGKA